MHYFYNKKYLVESIEALERYISNENYMGYDPYDTLLSKIPLNILGKWGSIFAIQFQKRNPINIRKLLGIPKSYNAKGQGLFLKSYSILYNLTKENKYLKKANYFYKWLLTNFSKGYSGYCWGYNFPWVTPKENIEAFLPTSVATATICKGLYEYYKITNNEEIINIILSASKFIQNDLKIYHDKTGICYSYTPNELSVCYNASLLAGEVIGMAYKFSNDSTSKQQCIDLVNFVIKRQKEDGRWNYSFDLEKNIEREQIDFHQGYILESIYNIKNLINYTCEEWENALKKGMEFYFQKQFLPNGQSLWRYPKKYPVDIHNQSQGIITFALLKDYGRGYLNFANQIAVWTIANMQDKQGYFYYRKYPLYTNKIPYMRWGQAWMFNALVSLIKELSKNELR